jgi:MFS superfamily sulfate permease-like transporter
MADSEHITPKFKKQRAKAIVMALIVFILVVVGLATTIQFAIDLLLPEPL